MEAFYVTVLPRTPRVDVDRLDLVLRYGQILWMSLERIQVN